MAKGKEFPYNCIKIKYVLHRHFSHKVYHCENGEGHLTFGWYTLFYSTDLGMPSLKLDMCVCPILPIIYLRSIKSYQLPLGQYIVRSGLEVPALHPTRM